MAKRKKTTRWRDAFAEGEVIQRVRPTYSDDYLGNPHKGTTTFQRFEGDALYPGLGWNDSVGPEWFKPPRKRLKNKRYPPTTISYCRWLWSVLEPEKGRIRYDIIDGALKAAADRGQTLQIRTQPFIGGSTPAWYWETSARHVMNGEYKVPDHNDPLYLKHWGDHIRALGKRYDGHPALESFDMAYGGSCGETGGNTNDATAEKLIDVYLKAFKKTQLIGMLGTHGNTYAHTKTNRNIGWRADCYGDLRADGHGQVPDSLCWNHMRDAYPMEVELNGCHDTWKHAPITLETCWTVAYWHKMGWDIDWIIEQGYKYHLSVFMPKSVYFPDEWMDKMMAFSKRIGYRFHIHNMILPLEKKAGQKMEVRCVIDNKGIAPIYRPYRFAFRFTQGKNTYVVPFKQDIRSWMPDYTYFSEKITFPKELKRGEVAVACGIVDDTNTPVVRFAMKPVEKSGWHPLTHMDVTG